MKKSRVKKKVVCRWNRKPKNAPDANIAYQYITEIKERRKGITAELLEIEAKRKKSPLHNCFEWDDTKAGREYRIIQAREILRRLVVEIEPEEEEEESRYVRAFIAPTSVEEVGNTSYVTIEEVCNNKELEEAYIRQLRRDLNIIKNKIKAFRIFSEVVNAIEKITI